MALASDCIPDLHLVGAGAGTQCLPLYRYDNQGNRVDNITDWALAQFRAHYAAAPQPPGASEAPGGWPDKPTAQPPGGSEPPGGLTKLDIFHYVYAVLHHPAYRQKYELNLKREFPRIHFYPDFWQWAAWGEQLMQLHLHYETIEPYPLQTSEVSENLGGLRQPYKAKLKAHPTLGTIELDTYTTLSGVPPLAWTYKLGNRSAIEWVLDRYKESTPKDPTIREQFNSYRFRDYKEQVIELLGRVTAVSLQTMSIIADMPQEM